MYLISDLRKKPLAALLVLSCGVVPVVHGQQPTAAAAANGSTTGSDACTNATAEAQLRQKETALLGKAHANEHAMGRQIQCRMKNRQLSAPSPSATLLSAARTKPTNTGGQWSDPVVIPVPGITAVLLNNGKVLFWSYEPSHYQDPNNSNTGVSYIWDPATKTGHSIAPPENIWCGGQTVLNDGRVYVAGGNLRYPDPNAAAGLTGWEGALTHYTFDPQKETWTRQMPDMSVGRWYPTTTQLPDNRVLITSGYDQTGSEAVTNVVELFTPTANNQNTMSVVSTHNPTGLYPFQFMMPSGQMLQAGPDISNSALLTVGTWSWANTQGMLSQHYGYGNGISYTDASVNPNRQTVMLAGGVDYNAGVALKRNEWIDGFNPGGGWKAFPEWLYARHNSNSVILPDGTLFTVGGTSVSALYDNPVWQTEIYNKTATDLTGSWIETAPITIPAGYHSSALLLPDATVLLSEDDRDPSSASSHRVQIYSPPYLFKGARPQITSAPAQVARGQLFSIGTNAKTISSVMLIAPGAVTHGNDMHQRAIKLATQGTGSNLRATIPSSSGLVPPGYYMLFIVDGNGVPSVAKFVSIG
ncbi:galactose oxidase-like domain-containing protein [Noviherbaspirillum sp. 1P10PC]|uniref:galactose oxidase-like domain-containing protein n=1 Tax=Noviherbaspirillum sp. 1P10PC TaxID=3132292 RepID=UPI0039A3C080